MSKYEDLKGYLLDLVNELTKKSPQAGPDMYNCPICQNDKTKTGALHLRGGVAWKCFACGESGDIVDLYQKVYKVDHGEAVDRLAQKFLTASYKPVTIAIPEKDEAKEARKRAAIAELRRKPLAVDVPAALSYLEGRGISTKTLKRFEIRAGKGYHPTLKKNVEAVIFFSKGYESTYVSCRQYEAPVDPEAKTWKLGAFAGATEPFNFEAVSITNAPVFVVEGEVDALSLEEIGCNAVALPSASNWKKFAARLEESGKDPCLVLMLDNDETGEKAEAKLFERLRANGLRAVRIDRKAWGYKSHDPNDWLREDRAGFEKLLNLTLSEFDEMLAEIEAKEEREAIQSEAPADEGYIDLLADSVQQDVVEAFNFVSLGDELDEINAARSAHSVRIGTGLDSVDKLLKGGLKECGLYLLGARSALGKSALSQQIADHIAKSRPVLYYSFEMSKEELITRSYTRLAKSKIVGEELDSSDIEKRLMADPNDPYLATVKELYKESAKNFYCRELDWPTVEAIAAEVKAFSKLFGQAPVVFVDYLQLIQTEERTNDTNAQLSKVSRALKLIANDCPVFVISSINRAAYYDVPSLDSFKGCGDIEYSANVAMLLTPAEFRYDIDKYQQANKALWDSLVGEANKNLTLTVVKGRDVPLGRTFLYNAGASYLFTDVPEEAYEELLETRKELDTKTQQTTRYKAKDKSEAKKQAEIERIKSLAAMM